MSKSFQKKITNANHDTEGFGLDVVKIARVRQIVDRTPSFVSKVFTDAEIEYCSKKYNPAIHFATHFAAKEAALKALGCGIYGGIKLKNVEVLHDEHGRPTLNLYKKANDLFNELNVKKLEISMTFTADEAVACVICIYGDKPAYSLIKSKSKQNTTDKIMKAFKQIKGNV